MGDIIEKGLDFVSMEHAMNVFGNYDENIRLLEEAYKVKVLTRGTTISISGEEKNVENTESVVKKLLEISRQGETITRQNVIYLIGLSDDKEIEKADEYLKDSVCLTAKGKQIKYKTRGQKNYVDAIKSNDIVFGIGPAGTGKTFLAVAMAVTAFRNKEVDRIILTRPAVEAGEKLGFLPGDLQNKVDPYLRPLYDGLYEIMGGDLYVKYLERGMIEIAPLAYMRGRTLDNSFIILDEAQNTTPEQMKMFLTRLGFNSKAVITGDITQIDLPGDKKSGLKEASKILTGVEGLEFVYLTEKDVVRHELVQRIIRAYDKYDAGDKK